MDLLERWATVDGLRLSNSPLQADTVAGPGRVLADPSASAPAPTPTTRKKSRRGGNDEPSSQKRRCVSTACVACRRRKSKCNGALPSCSACSSVYGTECVYDPSSDHRRKGVYRDKLQTAKARDSTLQIVVEAILGADDEDVLALVKMIRASSSMDDAAESILKQDLTTAPAEPVPSDPPLDDDDEDTSYLPVDGEQELARKMGALRLENGSVRFIGGTSHLIYLGDPATTPCEPESDYSLQRENPVTSWTAVTKDPGLVVHLINLYFNWHYPFFTTLSKNLFYRDFLRGKHGLPRHAPTYCSPLLVNAMLALGCHFTSVPDAYAVPGDNRTRGDHFFAEAKALTMENVVQENPQLTTVQALALMSVREAGCGHEARGWVYSGMSFRMAQDIGLNLDVEGLATGEDTLTEEDVDARRITFWGCFLFDKCWSNYMGRIPQMPKNTYNVPKFDVFPGEDAEMWSPYTDGGFDQSVKQPARTRAVALQLSRLCEISSEILLFFYHPKHIGRSNGKSAELQKLSELHRYLEAWKSGLPKEFEPKEGQLPNVILMHIFYHLQYIHLFRPFLKYKPSASPLQAHVSPRRICTANAVAVSKLMRLYKKFYSLRQICNIAVYMLHSACTIHMLNLPDKAARRDFIHGVKQLAEIAEDWPCARRNLAILSVLGRKWKVDLPEEAAMVLQRTNEKYGTLIPDVPSPTTRNPSSSASPPSAMSGAPSPNAGFERQYNTPVGGHYAMQRPSPQLAELVAPGLPADTNILDSLAMSASSAPSRGGIATAPMGGDTVALAEGIDTWSVSATTQPMRNYVSGYLGSGRSPPQTQTQAGMQRHISPGSSYALDGQDWYFRDSVNWQQNFEAWAPGPALHGGVGVDATGGSVADPSVFVFNGLRGDELNFNFDSFNAMSALDHLPGLE